MDTTKEEKIFKLENARNWTADLFMGEQICR